MVATLHSGDERAMLEHTETFEVDRFGFLVRRVTPKWPHKPYVHRCALAFYERVAHEVDELGEAGFTGEDIVARTGIPHSCVFTALAFMKERGCIISEGKRNFAPGCGGVHADAMLEYHALRENS